MNSVTLIVNSKILSTHLALAEYEPPHRNAPSQLLVVLQWHSPPWYKTPIFVFQDYCHPFNYACLGY